MPMNTDFDAIVVGSGISGGWAAKELSEKGLKVLVLERGAPLTHGTDYVGEHRAPWETCLLYTSPSPRDRTRSRMPSSA